MVARVSFRRQSDGYCGLEEIYYALDLFNSEWSYPYIWSLLFSRRARPMCYIDLRRDPTAL